MLCAFLSNGDSTLSLSGLEKVGIYFIKSAWHIIFVVNKDQISSSPSLFSSVGSGEVLAPSIRVGRREEGHSGRVSTSRCSQVEDFTDVGSRRPLQAQGQTFWPSPVAAFLRGCLHPPQASLSFLTGLSLDRHVWPKVQLVTCMWLVPLVQIQFASGRNLAKVMG